MRIFITGAIVLAGWLGLGGYWHVCQIRCLCGDDNSEPNSLAISAPNSSQPKEEHTPSKEPWKIRDGQGLLYSFAGSTQLQKGNFEVKIDPEAQGFADSLLSFHMNNPNDLIEVVGYFDPSEAAPEGFENMGLARAEEIRQRLIEQGIDGSLVMPRGEAVAPNFNQNGWAAGGIQIKTLAPGNNLDPTDQADGSIEDSPGSNGDVTQKTLYCNFGKSAFNSDPELETYAAQAKAFLDQNPDQTMYLTGHTDDKGTVKTNIQFGRSRAGKARRFFRDQGIALRRIKIASKGESEPIATNDTEEGRALNRRVQIVIE